jgi:ATP-dependent protease ClpP protease subunit
MTTDNRIFNSAMSENSLVLTCYDAIGEDMFGAGITAQAFQQALDAQPDYSDITLRVNSPGGDAFAGVAIYNLLKASKKPVNVIVDGLAASAASIVCMAGDTITMNQGSVMMIHEAQALAMGDKAAMLKMADTLETVTGSIADIYVGKTKNSKKSVLAMMAAETWMDPKDAVANGFATAVGKAGAIKNSFDLSRFKNTPIELQAKTKEVAGEHLTAGDFIYIGNPDDTSTWSLPWHFSSDEKTKSHLRDALARWDQDEKIPESHKAECHAKLLRLCAEHGIDVSRKGNPKNAAETLDKAAVEQLLKTHEEQNNQVVAELEVELARIEIERQRSRE